MRSRRRTSRSPTRRSSRRRSTAAARTSSRAARASRATRATAACRRWSTRAGSRSARNLAVSEGSVVAHTDVFELIQYRPTTAEVYETPLLIVPPTINKYYIVDLAPGRSLVEYLVGQGHQVFCISWRNPDAEHELLRLRHLRAGGARGARRRSPRSRGTRRRQRDGGVLGRDHHRRRARASRRGGPARRGREPDAARVRARQRAGGHGRGARQPAGGGRRGRRVGAARLPRRRRAGHRVRVAAPERPDLELRRQQLPARQGAARVRHPLLEPGHGPHGRRACTATS